VVNVKELTKEERDKRIAEMEKKAQILDYQKNLQLEEKNLKHKQHDEKRHSTTNKPDFIKKHRERHIY